MAKKLIQEPYDKSTTNGPEKLDEYQYANYPLVTAPTAPNTIQTQQEPTGFWQKTYNKFASIFNPSVDTDEGQMLARSVHGSGLPNPALWNQTPVAGGIYGNTDLREPLRQIIRLRDSNEYIDITGAHTSRLARYKEYERMMSIPEVRTAINIYANDTTRTDQTGHTFQIRCRNENVKKELQFLFWHILELDHQLWGWARNLCVYGDHFLEIIADPEYINRGVLKVQELPAATVFRIETVKGRLLEFQQSNRGPDYNVITGKRGKHFDDPGYYLRKEYGSPQTSGSVIRFHPQQIIHTRLPGMNAFYPYGESVLEGIRYVADQLKKMEDAMMIYRLTRAPERRIFYIDVGNLPPNKVESYLERMRDKLRKKKVGTVGSGSPQVSERWNILAVDEDFWMPTRANSNTKIDTLPGAENLGEVDDVKYFLDKLFSGLGIPRSYVTGQSGEGGTYTAKAALSAQNVEFAQTIERIQKTIAKSLRSIATRHLEMIGAADVDYADLDILITTASDIQELARAEIVKSRLESASSLKTTDIVTDRYIMTNLLNMTEQEADKEIERMEKQIIRKARLAAGADPDTGQPLVTSGGLEGELGAGGAAAALGGEEGGGVEAPGAEEAGGGAVAALTAPPEEAEGETPSAPEEGEESAPEEETPSAEQPIMQQSIQEPSLEDLERIGLAIKDFNVQEMDDEETDPAYIPDDVIPEKAGFEVGLSRDDTSNTMAVKADIDDESEVVESVDPAENDALWE